MRLVFVSDTHSQYDFVVPDGDVLVHCGDFTLKGGRDEIENFDAWLAALPHKDKIVIAGNHELSIEQMPAIALRFLKTPIYLQDRATIQDWQEKVWADGSPANFRRAYYGFGVAPEIQGIAEAGIILSQPAPRWEFSFWRGDIDARRTPGAVSKTLGPSDTRTTERIYDHAKNVPFASQVMGAIDAMLADSLADLGLNAGKRTGKQKPGKLDASGLSNWWR